jgi:hypothetical protein
MARAGPSNGSSSIRENVAMGWKVLLGVVILLLVGAVGLAIYGSSVDPVQQPREEVLPNERFGN